MEGEKLEVSSALTGQILKYPLAGLFQRRGPERHQGRMWATSSLSSPTPGSIRTSSSAHSHVLVQEPIALPSGNEWCQLDQTPFCYHRTVTVALSPDNATQGRTAEALSPAPSTHWTMKMSNITAHLAPPICFHLSQLWDGGLVYTT